MGGSHLLSTLGGRMRATNTAVRLRAERFVPVPKPYLRRDTVTGFDIYVASGRRFVLYHAADAPFDRAAERRLQDSAPNEFYIRSFDQGTLRSYLRQHLRASLAEPIPPHERARILMEASGGAVAAVMANPGDGGSLQAAADVAVIAMEQVIGEPRVLGALVALGQVGTHVYGHAVRCCLFAAALGHRAGVPMSALSALAVGGLLHDIGHARLDPSLVARPERSFSGVERTIFERHPVLGAEIVAQGRLPREAAVIVRQHHERLAGGGYPAGVAGEELGLGARVVSVVDAYDRLRNPSDGRDSLSAFHALATMRYRMSGWFDPGLLTEFVQLLGSVEPE